MARMPDFETEIKRDLGQLARVFTHHGVHPFDAPVATRGGIPAAASPAPASQPVNLRTTAPKESTMSLSADLKAFAGRLDTLGEEAVTKLEAVAANPATAEVFDVLHTLTGLGLDPSIISGVASGLKTLVSIYTPDPAQQAAPPAAPAPQQVPA